MAEMFYVGLYRRLKLGLYSCKSVLYVFERRDRMNPRLCLVRYIFAAFVFGYTSVYNVDFRFIATRIASRCSISIVHLVVSSPVYSRMRVKTTNKEMFSKYLEIIARLILFARRATVV